MNTNCDVCCFLQTWKKQVYKSPLVRVMRIYWPVFYRNEQRRIGYRYERLYFTKKIIKKRLPKWIIPYKVWFFAVETYGMLNPFLFSDDEHYVESLRLWKERDMKAFIDENPRLRPHRHEKICKYRKTLRV